MREYAVTIFGRHGSPSVATVLADDDTDAVEQIIGSGLGLRMELRQGERLVGVIEAVPWSPPDEDALDEA